MARMRSVAATAGVALVVPLLAATHSAAATPQGVLRCGSGARTLSGPGDHVYTETGNGGYRSVHTDVHIAYDAPSNEFLPGTHVDLTDQATQCLTDFSLDLERTSAAGADGPDLDVQGVDVNGQPAAFRFAQPTYPGDPSGPDDPDPRAHQAGQHVPVGGPQHNPLPPACSPQLTGDSADAQDGQPCPATKLVITPARSLPAGRTFTVSVHYAGRPGLHVDGDGSTEGWFRSDDPPGDGGFVTTEPVGTEDWMPLNDHPSAKPTYDFYDTVNPDRTAVGNGVLVDRQTNAPDASFPAGSTTWHWRSGAPVASYLVENSIGHYTLASRLGSDGVRYYTVQASAIPAAQRQANQAIIAQQQDVTAFESQFNGRFPFRSDGVLVGTPPASFEEEMQTMITFAGGQVDLDTLYHENMHQWWGDNVSEANYDLTFFKEGLATLAEYLYSARTAADAAGGQTTPAGRAAFEANLVTRFNGAYARSNLWSGAPSDPTPFTLFSGSSTYTRPGLAYTALRRILGPDRFAHALQYLQHRYGGATVTEPALEDAFRRVLPVPSAGCQQRLGQFFQQWFDTAYPTPTGATKPTITGPGLAGEDFYGTGGCRG